MARLLIHVEGQTEETFVKEVLRAHLLSSGYQLVGARIVGNPRNSGICEWSAARKGIINHLKEDAGCVATTMVDYYGLPPAWPGRTGAIGKGTLEKARSVEDALRNNLTIEMGPRFD